MANLKSLMANLKSLTVHLVINDIKQVKSDMNELNGQITEFGKELEEFNVELDGFEGQISEFSGRMDNFITSGYLEDKKFICEDNLNNFDIVTDESLTKTLSGYTTTEQVTGMIKFHIPDSLE